LATIGCGAMSKIVTARHLGYPASATDETGNKTDPGKPGVCESGGEPPFDSAQDKPHAKWRSTELPRILSLRGLAFFRLFYCCFGGDETDLGMLAIAEGLVQASTATA
jgi:hypothetical protein